MNIPSLQAELRHGFEWNYPSVSMLWIEFWNAVFFLIFVLRDACTKMRGKNAFQYRGLYEKWTKTVQMFVSDF